MTKPSVIFDLDGVLADFNSGYIRVAKELGVDIGRVTGPGGIKEWSFATNDDIWDYIEKNPKFWLGLNPLFTRDEGHELELLAKEVDLIYVTARHGDTEDITRLWLSMYVPEGRFVFFTQRKYFIAQRYSAIACIDDRPDTLEGYHEHKLPAIARSWRYNKDISPEIPRVESISEFIHLVYDRIDAAVLA